MPKNKGLNSAGVAKRDEFYTPYNVVEEEAELHVSSFRGASVLCNCDDPVESNFVGYFLDNFNRLGLKGLYATSYSCSHLAEMTVEAPYHMSNLYIPGQAYGMSVTNVPSDFCRTTDWRALFDLEGNDLHRLDGDGDFRSPECLDYLGRADIVVTNPPFSLFRDFFQMVSDAGKRFLILGNVNVLTAKEVFPKFKSGELWIGKSIRSGDRKFYVPESYPMDASICGRDGEGRRFIRVKGVRWFTNLRDDSGFEDLPLVKAFNDDEYPCYENYRAIEVRRTKFIPRDYFGVMGVPITFLDRYNPEQFEILMLANGNARTSTAPAVLEEVGYRRHPLDKGGVGIVDGKRVYARVLIRRQHAPGRPLSA